MVLDQARFHLGRVPFLLTASLSHCHQLGNHLKCHCHQMSLNVTNCHQLKCDTKSALGKVYLIHRISLPRFNSPQHVSHCLGHLLPILPVFKRKYAFMFKQMFWKVIETSSFASDQVLLKPSPPSAGASGRTCRLYVTTFVIVNFTFTYSDIGNSEPAFRWRKHPVSLTLHQSPSLNISIIFGFSMVMILYSVMCFQAFW